MDNNPFILSVKDSDIVETYKRYKSLINHTDAPTEYDLVKLREVLSAVSKEVNTNMLSLHWLRNRIVALRKEGRLG